MSNTRQQSTSSYIDMSSPRAIPSSSPKYFNSNQERAGPSSNILSERTMSRNRRSASPSPSDGSQVSENKRLKASEAILQEKARFKKQIRRLKHTMRTIIELELREKIRGEVEEEVERELRWKLEKKIRVRKSKEMEENIKKAIKEGVEEETKKIREQFERSLGLRLGEEEWMKKTVGENVKRKKGV
ncbi:uncharacterized protein BP5553_05506 [Venustampulla echinocandica]|uniref:Uncharacterized protein n=1 Tax=Venustampulla echinocandica TaxID=2656787 RepID=A0A370TRD4_9HELO|nr:uncharacterized protein BP5553_05506 [Venustampulla echinocandica]RDL38073.1 hypothetical protein BP5553_05506 [Venustampulla echinocandica]